MAATEIMKNGMNNHELHEKHEENMTLNLKEGLTTKTQRYKETQRKKTLHTEKKEKK